MKERERWTWFGGTFVGCGVVRALAHGHPLASFATLCATVVWNLGWLWRDNLQFRNEVAAQRKRLDERKAAVATRRGRSEESRS